MDKIFITLIIAVTLFIIIARRSIAEEFRLLKQAEAKEQVFDLSVSFFFPSTLEEKLCAVQTHIAEMTQIQNRVDKSFLSKYVIDYREHIFEKQQYLAEREAGRSEDDGCLRFSTVNLHSITAHPQLEKASLMHLASEIDDAFEGDDDSALFIVGLSDDQLGIEISPYYGFTSFEPAYFQEFIDQVSCNVFEGEPITLYVGSVDSDGMETYTSA